MIRIGSSCALSIPMVIGYVAETRILTDCSSHWEEVARYCIDNDIYLIVTPCINDGYNHAKIPSNEEWTKLIANTCSYLKSIGANHNNTRLSIINEPMKFCTKEKYAELINMAVPITHSYGFKVGAGNEEFITAQARGNMYQYILSHCQFDILDIHIQGSCDTKEKTEYWTNTARSWTDKQIDCTEAFYSDIGTWNGWQLLLTQLSNAERIGCKNFCNVFNNLDQSAFPLNTDNWKRLSFCVNGKQRSPYWQDWLKIIEQKAPVPNIINLISEEEDMKLEILRLGSKGNQVKWLQEILEIEYGFENEGGFDGIYGVKTEAQVKAYQSANRLLVDGKVGKDTIFDLIIKSEMPDYWWKKLLIYMAYER
ncbi:MAG: peptidoglycan-binding domain-containing protein [Methanofastidiosum sp.]